MSEYASMLNISGLVLNENATVKADCYNAIIIKNGALTASIGADVLTVPQNHLIVLSSDTVNYIKADDNLVALSLAFDGSGEILEKIKCKAFELDEDKVNLIFEIAAKSDNLKLYKYDSALRLIFSYCYETDSADLISDKKDAILFGKAVSILEDNVGGDISVNELSEVLKISLSHIKRLFAKYSYLGAHEYLLALKILRAKELLKQNVSVTETARLVGFATQAYFSAAFKKITGVSPKSYFSNDTEVPLVKPKTQPRPKRAPETKKENLPSYLL
ncbi:MAG: helix-turn-helix transcriptional regulator [Clostridia bacterium]|nr:helix-turn-helix transcriptional regulator [Clostridia bacterium]